MTRILTPLLAALKNRGLDFRVCNNTLPSRHLCSDAAFMKAKLVALRRGENALLQTREGYVNLKS